MSHYPLDLPDQDPILVYADQDRLQQVLGNFLTNALKFSPEAAPVRVGITLETEVARVWVQDQGPGLSDEQQTQIWQQFYQASTTPVQSGWKPGLGLGLYISRQLILHQQGQVGVESHPGQGAPSSGSHCPSSTPHDPRRARPRQAERSGCQSDCAGQPAFGPLLHPAEPNARTARQVRLWPVDGPGAGCAGERGLRRVRLLPH